MRFFSFKNIFLLIAFTGATVLLSAFQSQSGGFGSFTPSEVSLVENRIPVADNTATAGKGAAMFSSYFATSAIDTVPGTSSAEDPSRQEFKKAPDFTLETLEGASFTLSEYIGDVVVLNIWATWCPPCREEIPDFIELQEEMKDDGVHFIGVSVDEEGWEAVRPFAKEYDFNYPLVVDNGIVRKNYGPFRGIPTTFIINKRGHVEYVAPGLVTKEMLKPALEELASR